MALALLSLASSSCQRIFTSSLAPFLARDGYTIPSNLSVADAAYLLSQSQGNSELAASLVTPLYNAASEASYPSAAYDEAASLLAQALIQASDINTGISMVLDTIPLDGSATQAELDAAFGAFSVVDISAAELVALDLIMTNSTPLGSLSAAEAYTIAAALIASAANNAGVSDPTAITVDQQNDLDADPAYALAFDFLTLAASIEAATSTETMLGQLIGQFSDSFPAP
jgi:hypothetical protein